MLRSTERTYGRAYIGVLLLGLAVLLAACGGGRGPSTQKPKPGPTPVTIHGQVWGPPGVGVAVSAMTEPFATEASATSTRTMASRDRAASWPFGSRVEAATGGLAGEVNVDNVSVLVYVLADYVAGTGTKPVAETTTDGDGKYSVQDIPSGNDLLVIVGSKPRLSAIVLAAGKDTQADVNSVTTLAAEAWLERLRGDHSIVMDQDLLQRTLDVARNALPVSDGAALLAALSALVPERPGDGWPVDLPLEWRALADDIAGSIPTGPQLCWNLELLHSSATPASRLTIRGIAPDWMEEETFARFEVPGHDEWTPVYIELMGGDEADVFMPLHPDDYMSGGSGDLVIYNEADGVTCGPIEITVESLDAAPAGMRLTDMFDALEQSLVDRAAAFGYEKADLLAMDLTQLAGNPDHYVVAGLAAGLQMLTGDGVTTNMRDTLGGSLNVGGQSDFSPEDLELVEALAYTNGFSREMMDFVQQLPHMPGPRTAGASAGASAGMALMTMQPLQGGMIPSLPHTISTPAELDYWMEARTNCTVWDDAWLRAPREIAGGMASAVSLVPGTQIATGPFLAFLTVSQMAIDICSNLLPHTFTAFDVSASPGEHNEDSDPRGTWEAKLYVTGKEWTLDWPTVLGAAPGVGNVGKVITKVAKQFGDNWRRAEPLLDWMQGLLFDVWGIRDDSGPLTLDPLNPPPIVIDPSRSGEEEYIKWTIEPDDGTFVFGADPKDYVATDVGDAQIWVRTQSDKFQGEFAGGHALLEVKPIEVEVIRPGDWPPSPYFVEPGEEIGLAAVVANADDKTVEWEWTGGDLVREDGGLGDQLARYTAPMDLGSYVVTAKSATRTGLRESGQPPRTGFAEIIVGGLRLSPQSACVEVGDSLPLQAFYGFNEEADFADLVVEVSGSAGYMSGNVFHAVSEGTVTVEIWDPDFPEWGDEGVFTVSDECEGFSVSVGGADSFSVEGTCSILFGRDVHMVDGFGNRVTFTMPRDVIDDLEAGAVEFAAFDSRIDITYPMSNMTFETWSTVWTEEQRGTVTVWGEWRTIDLDIPGEPGAQTELFFISGSFDAVVGNEKRLPSGELVMVAAPATAEFRGVTDGFGSGGTGYVGEYTDVVCEDARPL